MTAPRAAAWRACRRAPRAGLADLADRDDPWATWARAVLVMSCGDYGGAIAPLESLADQGDPELAGLACARIASGLRQIDEHAAAVAWDERAMATAGSAVTDGLVGRAADAVGAGAPDTAARFLAQARARATGDRDHIRIAWVACEIALLGGRPRHASDHADRALDLSRHLGSPRHIAKSTLFAAAARHGTDPLAARQLLAGGWEEVRDLHLRPLLWPMVLLLGSAATPPQRTAAAEAVTFIGAHLPPGAGAVWRARGDVARLRG